VPYLAEDSVRIARAYYEFAVDGGAVGDIALRGDSVPPGPIIIDALLKVDTALTGASATVALKTEGAADIQAAAAISGAPWSTAGVRRCTLDADSAPILTTADRAITATVGTAALTAGKFTVLVTYLLLAG